MGLCTEIIRDARGGAGGAVHAVTPRKQRCVDSSGEAAAVWIESMSCSICDGTTDEELLIICDGGCGMAQHSYCKAEHCTIAIIFIAPH